MLVLAMQFSRGSTAALRLVCPHYGGQREIMAGASAVPTCSGVPAGGAVAQSVGTEVRSLKAEEKTTDPLGPPDGSRETSKGSPSSRPWRRVRLSNQCIN
jgi:hypothetical protein